MKHFGPESGIAPWKIDSKIERFLAKKADSSEFWKTLYVYYYKLLDSKYYRRGVNIITKNIQHFDGLSYGMSESRLRKDMIYSLHRFGCMFDEYFLFDFPRLNTYGRDSFVTDKNRWYYQYTLFNGVGLHNGNS